MPGPSRTRWPVQIRDIEGLPVATDQEAAARAPSRQARTDYLRQQAYNLEERQRLLRPASTQAGQQRARSIVGRMIVLVID